MSYQSWRFLADETAAVTLDWVVLTAALVGTGLAVVMTVRSGVDTVSGSTAADLRGQVIRSSFASESCPDGLDGLQFVEDRRALDADQAPIPVVGYLASFGRTSNEDFASVHRRMRARAESAPPGDPAHTYAAALACGMTLRGLD